MADLVHELISESAMRTPDAEAVAYQGQRLNYGSLVGKINAMSSALLSLGLDRNERVAVYIEKRIETVVALFGCSTAGGVFVPINPLLKPEQVAYILCDCNVRILVTSAERLSYLGNVLKKCQGLHTVVVVGTTQALPPFPGINIVPWNDVPRATQSAQAHRTIDSDMAAILYTSGSTGMPKGVVLSHRNLVAGAKSVAEYLHNTAGDRILSVLPLSFDYGLSQLTTAFYCGASIVLMNYLLPRDIIKAVKDERITGLAAVPPLWIQLGQQKWEEGTRLRYITNSGGKMPRSTLSTLRNLLPQSKIYLMYGLTEAFRSTILSPTELDKRPDSIGKAIPNAEVMVVRQDGTLCDVNEPGELVHRGALVALGYWNDPEKTAERFKPAPRQDAGLTFPEIAVWSGDTVSMDEDGFLYFIGRNDDMIKVSGYRVSPTEVEEVVHTLAGVAEVAAMGIPHATLGQAIAVVVHCIDAKLTHKLVMEECQRRLPAYMVPAHIEIWKEPLPRNSNGKIDRKSLQVSLISQFSSSSQFDSELKI